MPSFSNPAIGQELLNVPMGDMIREMAFAIADAQIRLDENSIEVAEMMGGLRTITDDNGNVTFEDSRVFFGRERLPLSSVLAIYNESNDADLKSLIKRDVIDGNPTLVSEATGDQYNLATTGDPSVTIPTRLSMLELGFTPTFYQFVDTIIEVKISISYTRESSSSFNVKSDSKKVSRSTSLNFQLGKGKAGINATRSKTVTTTQVNASYASKFNYSAEGSSLLRTKLTPIPPPAILEDRIRQLMEIESADGPSS